MLEQGVQAHLSSQYADITDRLNGVTPGALYSGPELTLKEIAELRERKDDLARSLGIRAGQVVTGEIHTDKQAVSTNEFGYPDIATF